MSDISIRKTGKAGRITLTRPDTLNAISHEMCSKIDAALRDWMDSPKVDLVILDAEGERAFCAGGDIQDLYDTGMAGDYSYGQRFWRDEYRLNAVIADYPKPIVSFLQGFTMGGGVGIGCHGSHRIVCGSSRIAMPECAIGLVPDVGGSLLLARAPGHLGKYLGTTGHRMGPGAAIFAGFADHFVIREKWTGLIAELEQTGDTSLIEAAAETPPPSAFPVEMDEINTHFAAGDLQAIVASLRSSETRFAREALNKMSLNSPLAMGVATRMITTLRRSHADMRRALQLEYRYTARAMEHGDFLEGIRAQIIDKDKNPAWRHLIDDLPAKDVEKMLAPLGETGLTFDLEDAMKIAVIGLGNMGAPMAANLARAGHDVIGFDPMGVVVDGVKNALSATEAAKNADVVLTMLPNGAILRSVASEVIPVMTKSAVLLDCSTVDVESARDVASQAEASGVLAVDAPVSGGIGGASAGTLTFMAGGSEAAFARVSPLFDIMGQKAVYCGASGAGQAAKICNNMILGITMIGTCEAFALADKLGLDRQKMYDVVSTSSGYSWSMNAYCPAPGVGPTSPADNDYHPGFAAELMLKDLRLSQTAAETVDADTPMGQKATSLYAQFVENEDGNGRDFSAMLPRFEKRNRS